MTSHKRRSPFIAPLIVGLVSAAGLVFALVGDGPLDALSWTALSAPVVILVRGLWR